MEISINLRDFIAGRVVPDPDNFVVGRIVIVGKINIITPEKVVTDERFIRMDDSGDIGQRKEFIRRSEQSWREFHDRRDLGRAGFLGRLQGQHLTVKSAGVVQAAPLMERDGFFIKLGDLSCWLPRDWRVNTPAKSQE